MLHEKGSVLPPSTTDFDRIDDFFFRIWTNLVAIVRELWVDMQYFFRIGAPNIRDFCTTIHKISQQYGLDPENAPFLNKMRVLVQFFERAWAKNWP